MSTCDVYNLLLVNAAAVSVTLTKDGELLLDPTAQEEQASQLPSVVEGLI